MAAELFPPSYSAHDHSPTRSDDTRAQSSCDSYPKKSLPSIPISNNTSPSYSRKRLSSFVSSVDARSRSPTLSSFAPQPKFLQRIFIKCPQALASLLENLPWVDFHALTCTSRDFRNILRNTEVKDVVLARYVPGYRWCVENCDMQNFRDVSTTITQLDLLCESIFVNSQAADAN